VAVVRGSNAFLPGEILAGRPARKSAEAVVMDNEPGAAMARINSKPEDSMT